MAVPGAEHGSRDVNLKVHDAPRRQVFVVQVTAVCAGLDGGNLAEVRLGRDAHLAEEAVQGKLNPVIFSPLKLAPLKLVAPFRRL